MSDNRYAPPVAPVQDAPAPGPAIPRPREIVLAVQLAIGGWLLGVVVAGLSWDYYSHIESLAAFVASQGLSILILVWLYGKIYAGRNWARVTMLVFTVIGFLFMFNGTVVNMMKSAPLLVKVNMVVGLVLNAATLWLLFFSPGREWFKKPR